MAAYTAIDDSEAYFQAVLYTGDGSTQAITLPGDTALQPDLVFIKGRDVAAGGNLTDSNRGVNKQLQSASQAAEETLETCVTTFGSDGFTIGSNGNVNTDTKLYVAWCWKESATAGVDLVGYTGNTAGASRTIAHSLSAVPDAIILKPRSYEGAWWYAPRDHPAKVLEWQNSNAEADPSSAFGGGGLLQSTFTSSVFGGTDGTSNDDLWNTDSATYIAYCFASKQGFSKFGSYTGNGNADGPFVYTGFKPAFVMIKNTGAAENWIIVDNKRNTHNLTDALLKPNLTNAESTSGVKFDLLSNGFKAKVSDAEGNSSGGSFIYAAFAEAPLVNSEGVPTPAR